MALSWMTFALEKDPVVWFGETADNVVRVQKAAIKTKTYYKEDGYELFSYHAVVSGLKAEKEYFYKVESASSKKFQSSVSSFTTARESGDDSPFTIAAYADMGADAHAVATNKYINGLVLKTYPMQMTAFGFFYEQMYNKFMNSMTNVMRQMAYMVIVGNHEAECHSPACLMSDTKLDQLGNYSAYNARFRMPSLESGGVLNMWYSFEYALVHITSISTETDYPDAPTNVYHTHREYGHFGEQLAWLVEDLKTADANRDQVPWIIVGMHRPMYTIRSCGADGTPNNEYDALKVQQAFEKLFIKYKVDLVFQAHVHMSVNFRRRKAKHWRVRRRRRLQESEGACVHHFWVLREGPKGCTNTRTRSRRNGMR